MVSSRPVRCVLFTVGLPLTRFVAQWLADAGHELVALVTIAGARRVDPSASGPLPPGTRILAPAAVADCHEELASLAPDLGIAAGFPIIPDTVAGIPRCGCVNLHPSLLPTYAGPNGFRAVYDAHPRIGATLHWVTADVDGGAILAQVSQDAPATIDPVQIAAAQAHVGTAALAAGVPRALSGAPGEPQDRARRTYAPRFTEAERRLTLELTVTQLQARFTALTLAGLGPELMLDGEARPLLAVTARPDADPTAVPAGVRRRRALLAAADGMIEATFGQMSF